MSCINSKDTNKSQCNRKPPRKYQSWKTSSSRSYNHSPDLMNISFTDNAQWFPGLQCSIPSSSVKTNYGQTPLTQKERLFLSLKRVLK